MVEDGRVLLLDERTANQIAAGEVVERPASVVKELCENALDADARRIDVHVEEGGRRLIRVVDDGCGMGPRDAVAALQRHATSKVRTADDLRRVRSLGFRGEALPSIAAVSRFELVTRRQGDEAAVRVRVEGGRAPVVDEVAAPPGTRVTVTDLFFHTPARLKFLRSAGSELQHVIDAVCRLCLARPECAFRLTHPRGELLRTTGSGRLADAALAVFGRATAGGLIAVDGGAAGIRVSGLIGRPEVARGNRQQQHFAVNGRPVRALALRCALEEAYHGLLGTGRFPVAALLLQIDPAEIDVNVHPTKQEVRFGREGAVRAAVYRAAREALRRERLVPGAEPTIAAGWEAARSGSGGAFGVGRGAEHGGARWEPPPAAPLHAALQEARAAREAAPGHAAEAADIYAPAAFLAELRPLGQALGTYLVCAGADGIYLVDQHAAHERICYDGLEARAGASAPRAAAQMLAVPLDVEIGPHLEAWWEEFGAALSACGFEAEPFGPGALLVRAVPVALGASAAEAVRRCFELLAEGRAAERAVDRLHEVRRAVAACHAAIKAGDPLSAEEAAALLQQLAATANPFTCPHGRPTVIRLSPAELERRFGRRA